MATYCAALNRLRICEYGLALKSLPTPDLESRKKTIYRVTRVLFGLGPSPLLLNGALQQHLKINMEIIKELSDGIYVDDIHIAGNNEVEVIEMKETAVEILAGGGFELHKWHPNSLKFGGDTPMYCDSTYAQEKLNVKTNESKLLGAKWNKNDKSSVALPKLETPVIF